MRRLVLVRMADIGSLLPAGGLVGHVMVLACPVWRAGQHPGVCAGPVRVRFGLLFGPGRG
jgi:hypothetical protein